ncbi:hypothetical protein ABT263_01850 [Kitasatospora sp. NPDC001603]|uniref:hypothetical protein n=1 Tax=Kitasatospora sp. NPDC001603 TaxID=3154388 RepID=UPI00332D2F9F
MDQVSPDDDATPTGPPGPPTAQVADEVTPNSAVVKCMGRTYGTIPFQGAVVVTDITDITCPVPLGDALPNGDGAWEVRSVGGRSLAPARDLLHAVAVLHELGRRPRNRR